MRYRFNGSDHTVETSVWHQAGPISSAGTNATTATIGLRARDQKRIRRGCGKPSTGSPAGIDTNDLLIRLSAQNTESKTYRPIYRLSSGFDSIYTAAGSPLVEDMFRYGSGI
jgi:hypothetical protein